jgi:hypothetical protein
MSYEKCAVALKSRSSAFSFTAIPLKIENRQPSILIGNAVDILLKLN